MLHWNYHRVYQKPILVLLLLLLALGGYRFYSMHTTLFPDIIFAKITVIADNGEQPVDKMMVTVTQPLEIAIKRVNGIQTVKSSTNRGSCTIEAYFDWSSDIELAKTQLGARIDEIKNELPPGTNIIVETMGQSIYPVMGYTLESDESDPIALRKTALYYVRPRLSVVPGMSNVVVRGGKTKEYVVTPDPKRLTELGISPMSLSEALKSGNFVESNGLLPDFRRLYLSITDARFNDIKDLKDFVIKNDGRRIIKVSDISKVDIHEQQEFIRINANGHDAITIDLIKQKGINLLDFSADVQKEAIAIQNALPKGMILKTYYNQSTFVTNSIDSVLRSIIEGLIMAIIVVIFFLKSFRASLNIILIIPVTLALSFALLPLWGITLNIMSLGAIAASIGLIIDDAIVIIEQLHRIHEENPGISNHEAVLQTMHELFPAMIGSSLSTIVIFLPFFLMTGVAGSFFRELTLTMEITLVCSFFVTWIGLPALHEIIGYKPLTNKVKVNEIQENTAKLHWLTWFFDKPVFATGFVILLIVSSAFLVNRLETGFLPVLDEGTIVLDYLTPPGTSLEASESILKRVDTIVMHHPDVSTYMRRTGTNMASSISMASGVIPPNEGDYLIQLKSGTNRKTEAVISEIRQQVSASEPALNIEFGQRIADLLGDLIGRPEPIEIKVFGDNQKILHELAVKIQVSVEKIKGIADVQNGVITDGPTLSIIPDAKVLSRFKLSTSDLHEQLKMHNQGTEVGQIQEGEQMVKILLRFTDFQNNSVEKLRKQPIFSPDGSSRPLSYYSKAELTKGDPEITREDLKSNIVVTARLENRDIGSAIQEIKKVIKTEVPLPHGCYVVYGGTYAKQQDSFDELSLILIIAIVLVFIILLLVFRNLRLAFLVIFISISGIGGSIWLLFITGVQLNVGSYTGIIMIVGIIAENSIFTVNQFLMSRTKGLNVENSINYAISLRIRPKLMTAICAILALTPLAMGFGLGAQMQQPLAIAVIGGFLAGLPLLLFVFPSFLRVLFKDPLPSDK